MVLGGCDGYGDLEETFRVCLVDWSSLVKTKEIFSHLVCFKISMGWRKPKLRCRKQLPI